MSKSKPASRRRVRQSASPLARLGQQAGYWTTPERAAAIGLSVGYMHEIERGEHLPSLDAIDRMAHVYKVTVQQIEEVIVQLRRSFAERMMEDTRDTA